MVADHTSFVRYLTAKKIIDDRSLNARVIQTFIRTINELYDNIEISILEAGSGIGTMIERILTWGIYAKISYTAIDLEPAYVAEAVRRLKQHGFSEEGPTSKVSRHILILQNHTRQVKVTLITGDAIEYARRKESLHKYHLVLAHAFLDLVNIYLFLPSLISCCIPGGLAYFTLNFDGLTILEPTVEADLDRQIIALYHETMDRRLVQGKSSGDSQTGRHLLPFLQKLGLHILDTGASDWFIFPRNGSYLNDDAYFLHFVIDTIYRALEFCQEMNHEQLLSWTAIRHRQIDECELFYMAHQMDILCQTPTLGDNKQ